MERFVVYDPVTDRYMSPKHGITYVENEPEMLDDYFSSVWRPSMNSAKWALGRLRNIIKAAQEEIHRRIEGGEDGYYFSLGNSHHHIMRNWMWLMDVETDRLEIHQVTVAYQTHRINDENIRHL